MPHPDNAFERWKRRRAQAPVPAGFADRVMVGVAAAEERRSWRPSIADLPARLWAQRPARVAVCAAAALICAARMLSVLGLFLAQFSVAE